MKDDSKGKHHLYTEIGEMMETKLARISQMSKENPGMVFTSIGHLISKELLTECHKEMDGKPATFDFLGFTHYCSVGRNGQTKNSQNAGPETWVLGESIPKTDLI